MKNVLIGAVLAVAGFAAAAGDVEVSAVRDYSIDRSGVRIGLTLPDSMLGATGAVTFVDGGYTRFSVGKTIDIVRGDRARLQTTVAGVYQDSRTGSDGLGVTVGVGGVVQLAKGLDFTAGVERFYGQDRLSGYTGNTVTAGLSLKY